MHWVRSFHTRSPACSYRMQVAVMCSVCPRLTLDAVRQSQDSSYLLLFFSISFVNVKEVVSTEP